MLSPAAHPFLFLLLPSALAASGILLAYSALRYADRLPFFPTWPRATRPPARHRMTREIAADPHRRDWAAIAAERINGSFPLPAAEPEPEIEYDPLDHRIPLDEVERRMYLFETLPVRLTLADGIEEVRERDGNAVWSWSDGKTLELVAAP